MPGTSKLVDRFRFVQSIDVTNDCESLDSEIAYWRLLGADDRAIGNTGSVRAAINDGNGSVCVNVLI